MILDQEIERYGATLIAMLRTLGALGHAHGLNHNLPSDGEGAQDLIALLQLRANIEDYLQLTIQQIYQLGYEDGENYAPGVSYSAHIY